MEFMIKEAVINKNKMAHLTQDHMQKKIAKRLVANIETAYIDKKTDEAIREKYKTIY